MKSFSSDRHCDMLSKYRARLETTVAKAYSISAGSSPQATPSRPSSDNACGISFNVMGLGSNTTAQPDKVASSTMAEGS